MCASAALAIALCNAGTAAAQERAKAATGNQGALEEIVVTARKFAERLQGAPVSVTSVGGERLERQGIRGLDEMAQITPSLTFQDDSDARQTAMIRGAGESSDAGVSPGVAMFVDGVYQPGAGFYSIPFFDIDRVEVLKGPQGTLYGKNTLGGAIAVYTREPEPDFGGKVSASYSTGNTIDTQRRHQHSLDRRTGEPDNAALP